MKFIISLLAFVLFVSGVRAEEGVGDAFDISCIDSKRFTITASGAKKIHDRGEINRYAKDGSVQCKVGDDNLLLNYKIREPMGHGACGGMPMLYLDVVVNGEVKTKFHKFANYCTNSIEKLDITSSYTGVSSIKMCGKSTANKDGVLVSFDGCISLFMKDYKRIKFDPKKDHMAEIINFSRSSN